MQRAMKLRQQIVASVQPPLMGGCTRDTPRCADARDYGSELRECCRGHLRDIVAHASVVLTEMRLVWWADYGTILGAVRNPLTTWADYPWLPQRDRSQDHPAPGIIPHDKDADFGILVDNSAAAFHLFSRVSAKIGRQFSHHVLVRPGARSMKIRLSFTNHTNADFFAWIMKPNGVMTRQRYINVDRYKGRDFHRDTLFPLTTVEWEGLKLPAPTNPAAFCEFRYGPNWMTPVRANNDGRRRGAGYFT